MTKPLHSVAELRVTAECCVVYKNKVLVQQRSADSAFFPGFLTLPGGHVDEGQVLWMAKEQLLTLDRVFPPIAYYLNHLFSSDKVLYMSSQCEQGYIKKITSETII